MIRAALGLGGTLIIAFVLLDGFEAMLLPRRISRSIRFARYYYQTSWRIWVVLSGPMPSPKRKGGFLSLYGPLSILVLFAIWAVALIAAFAMLQQAAGSRLNPAREVGTFGDLIYLSGVTFFTLGFGDLTPIDPVGRGLCVAEAGLGFAFLAVVISYLPVLYQAFSKREATISLMDARAGSPPSADQLLIRLGPSRSADPLDRLFSEWERWAAELLESHISFPLLSFYRSQHDNQSWLASLAMILDASSIAVAEFSGVDTYQARLTFAMARHAAVDLAQIFQVPPQEPNPPRLDPSRAAILRAELEKSGWEVRGDPAACAKLEELRSTYEPFLEALGRYFRLNVPPIVRDTPPVDNWQTSAWMRRTSGLAGLATAPGADDHDD